MNEPYSEDDVFSGWARLFPLPNLVFFPHVVQPLHIFEPRYRQMTADALAGDQRIAMVLPRSGWEKDYEGRPAIHDIACVGKIINHQKLEDGRYNLLLRGEFRVRLIEEVTHERLYRLAKAEVLEETLIENESARRHWRERLVERAKPFLVKGGEVQEEFLKLIDSKLPLGALADILAFALPLGCDLKQHILEESDVERRLERLVRFLTPKSAGSEGRPFPPEFSSN